MNRGGPTFQPMMDMDGEEIQHAIGDMAGQTNDGYGWRRDPTCHWGYGWTNHHWLGRQSPITISLDLDGELEC